MRVSLPRYKFVKQSEWFHRRQLSPEVGQGELNRGLWQHQLQRLTKSHVGVPLCKVTFRDSICCPTALPANFGTIHISSVCACLCLCVCVWGWVCLSCAFRELFLGGQSASKQSWQRDSEPALYLCLSLDRQRTKADMHMYVYHMWYVCGAAHLLAAKC